jgi:hypothetical protein
MRGFLLSLVCAMGILATIPQPASASVAPTQPAISSATPVMATPVYALQVADKKVDINITTSSGGGRWYRSPVWIAIMAIGGVVLLMLIVMAARGGGSGGTTIVK